MACPQQTTAEGSLQLAEPCADRGWLPPAKERKARMLDSLLLPESQRLPDGTKQIPAKDLLPQARRVAQPDQLV